MLYKSINNFNLTITSSCNIFLSATYCNSLPNGYLWTFINLTLLDINYTARYIIQNCGHHFEAAIKLYLKRTNKVRLIKVHSLFVL